MNTDFDDIDDIEDKLRKMAPAPMRPTFQARLLRRTPASRKKVLGLWVAVAAMFCVCVFVLNFNQDEPTPIEVTKPNVEPPETLLTLERFKEMPPTWLTYTRAAAVSLEMLDQVLSEHERKLLPSVKSLEAEFAL